MAGLFPFANVGRISPIITHCADYVELFMRTYIEVLQLIGAGKANNLIARDLAITEETVKGHVKNILSKLGASDRTHAVTIALKRGIIEL
jgi:Response regulator containing a CheY-like receiver domain and an HTH DNA-binding domain